MESHKIPWFQTTNQKITAWSFIVNPLSLVSPPLDWSFSGAAPSAADYLPETADACPGHVGTRHFKGPFFGASGASVPERSAAEHSERNKKNQPNSVGTESTGNWKPNHFVAGESWECSPLGGRSP